VSSSKTPVEYFSHFSLTSVLENDYYYYFNISYNWSLSGADGAQALPTAAAIMEPLLELLLNFEGMKKMEEGL
jgi:hypothetical protein